MNVLRKYNKCLQHSSVAYISDSSDERAVIVCHFEDQEIGPPAACTLCVLKWNELRVRGFPVENWGRDGFDHGDPSLRRMLLLAFRVGIEI